MKKIYYFSKSKLQFIEIRNYKIKLAAYFAAAVLACSVLLVVGVYLYFALNGSRNIFLSNDLESRELKQNLDNAIAKYDSINTALDNLMKTDNNLRLAVNLKPISNEESKVGIGGGSFDNILDFSNDPTDLKLKSLVSYVDEVSRKIAFEKSQFVAISKQLKQNKILYQDIPAIEPVEGPITSGFGMRFHPILHVWRMHDGIDILADVGTPVHSPGDGVVDFVGLDDGYGLTVKIDHGFGYSTLYGHLSKANVKEGEKVKRGDVIAYTGDSGLATGPHLHYEVEHDGVRLNPEEFFFGDLGYFALTNRN
jgi:murein DD-endopeptidase MepM/ murein hydrolase activator NlpD